MLLALEKKLLGEAKTGTAALPIGTLTDIQLYQQPRYGEVDGMAVRIEGEANRVGLSPVTKCVELGAHGDRETAWISAGLVKNIRLEPFGFPARGQKPRPGKNGGEK